MASHSGGDIAGPSSSSSSYPHAGPSSSVPGQSRKSSHNNNNNNNHDNVHAHSHTPLRRISRGSLAALSASRTREADLYGPTLNHLANAFAELAEGIEDLAVNCEALDSINHNLDQFNNAFAGLIFGLRMNAYTSDFTEPPNLRNFQHNQKRNQRLAQEAIIQAQQEEEELAARQLEADMNGEGDGGSGQSHPHDHNDDYIDQTFITLSGDNDVRSRGSRIGRGAPPTARGGSRIGGGGKTAGQKKKDQLIKFAGPIIQTMPIEFREKQPQRGDAETVISALKANPDGYRLQELVKLYPLIPQHRINDCLMALVRAKHAIKVTSKGLLYRLDPLKYPPDSS